MTGPRVAALGLLFLFFLLENSLHYLFPAQTFSLVLIAVICISLKEGRAFGAISGAWGGMLLEVFKTGPLGLALIPMALVGAAAGFMSSKIFRESFMAQIVMPVLAFYFFRVVNLGVFWDDFFFFEILLTVVLSPLVFFLLKLFLDRSPSRRSPRWEF